MTAARAKTMAGLRALRLGLRVTHGVISLLSSFALRKTPAPISIMAGAAAENNLCTAARSRHLRMLLSIINSANASHYELHFIMRLAML
jgi:hypothetical protein